MSTKKIDPPSADMIAQMQERARLNAQQARGSEPRNAAQMDLFLANLVDVAVKDDMATMEHPMFAIGKQRDMRVREFADSAGNRTRIAPGIDGLATVWDKDLLIYAVSQLIAARDQGSPISPEVRIRSIDVLHATRRGDRSESYKRLLASLRRLSGTRIETAIITGGKRTTKGFSWVDGFEIIDDCNGKIYEFTMTLPPWIYNAVMATEVLTMNPDYFELTGGLERRLYELARKHLGRQNSWSITLAKLYAKTGSSAPLRRFRFEMNQIAAEDPLPDYALRINEADVVTFLRRAKKPEDDLDEHRLSGTTSPPIGNNFPPIGNA